jgi:predicted CoA-binding protein
MNHDSYDDSYIRGILNTVKTIAMVGVSANVSRPSYFAFKYLLERRYRMIPVNPGLAGQELLGQKAYAKLTTSPNRSTWSISSAPHMRWAWSRKRCV